NDGIEHDVGFPEFKAGTDRVNRKGASSVTVFRADPAGEFAYFCSLPGHRQAGMEGKIMVGGVRAPVAARPPAVGIAYCCSLPGHRQAGVEVRIMVGGVRAPVAALPPSVSIVRNPVDLPGPAAPGPPRTIKVELEAVELVGRLANETT